MPSSRARRAALRFAAVPWRHPGLIALCALTGALAAAAWPLEHGPRTFAASVADAQVAASAQRPDGMRDFDSIEALVNQAPPAASQLAVRALAAPMMAARGAAAVPGFAAGLLLGLLVAALHELRGQRMRSAREAEWALGVPVLGTIPTLSARARDAVFARRRA